VSQTAERQIARGMRDVLPDEMARTRSVESAFGVTCRAWGYREVRTPVIEPLHLFTSAGTLSPQALDRIYSFLDWDGWSGERVVLRPDSTIPAARLYAEHLDGGRVAKLFYNQNVFRFTDDGSSREEWQCGVELIGDTGLPGDVELVMLAVDALSSLGIRDVNVRLSHAAIVRAVLAAAGLSQEQQSAAYDRLLDGDLSVVDEIESGLPQLNAPLRLLFEVEGAGSGYLANVRSALAEAVPGLAGPIEDLTFVVEALEAAGVQPVVQTVLMRNFEYYSGVVMKIDGPTGERLATGGRYDELIHALDASVSLHAVACPRLVPLIEGDDPFGEETAEAVREYAAPLREAGVDTVVLGCTHYPLVRPVFERVFGRGTTLVFSADETAREVAETLERKGIANAPDREGRTTFLTTGPADEFAALGERFLQLPIDAVRRVELPALEREAA